MEPDLSPLYVPDIGSLNPSHSLIGHEFIWRIGHELTGRMVLFRSIRRQGLVNLPAVFSILFCHATEYARYSLGTSPSGGQVSKREIGSTHENLVHGFANLSRNTYLNPMVLEPEALLQILLILRFQIRPCTMGPPQVV